jgi:predicted TIM-barrel fold metal-dependent hydrolase
VTRVLQIVICESPWVDAAAQLRLLEHMAGVIYGLKYHTTIAGASAALLGPSGFASWAVAADLPVTVHSWFTPEHSSAKYAVELAERYPDLRLNIAHAAGFDLNIIRRIEQLPNAFLDCAPWQLNLHDHHAVAVGDEDDWPTDPLTALTMLHDLAPTSLIWGADFPWTSRFDMHVRLDFSHESEVQLLHRLPPPTRRAISWGNTLRWLFGTSSPAALYDKNAHTTDSDAWGDSR